MWLDKPVEGSQKTCLRKFSDARSTRYVLVALPHGIPSNCP